MNSRATLLRRALTGSPGGTSDGVDVTLLKGVLACPLLETIDGLLPQRIRAQEAVWRNSKAESDGKPRRAEDIPLSTMFLMLGKMRQAMEG